jgi:MFS family permease
VSFISISLWLYTPEVYPNRMRALGCGIGTAWYRVAVIIAPIMAGLIVSEYSLSQCLCHVWSGNFDRLCDHRSVRDGDQGKNS